MPTDASTTTSGSALSPIQEIRQEYLKLVKRCLMNTIYQDSGQQMGVGLWSIGLLKSPTSTS